MTTTIMARPALRAAQPEYACQSCGEWHAGPCPDAAVTQMNDLIRRMVREADTRVPTERRARRTLQEMAPDYQRQPVLTLHRPTMADDACVLCERWNCNPTTCCLPPGAAAQTAPPRSGGGWQCEVCGGVFGAAPVTEWTCGACIAVGR
ncbi:hypothetical protein [Streptomyces sp. NPDC088785]|uniref:hypothetical protein n=1 Tax=Streptomyces sp. NPDC088785 TaxID=3365897 RepID=UPI003818B392